MNTIAIIPARSGSKGIKDKNIRKIKGFPLIAYSIAAAKLCGDITRVIVSTDSEEYARISVFFGAEVPFLRPKDLSGDSSLDIEYLKHALKELKSIDGYIPDQIVLLIPTTPIRYPVDIKETIMLLERDESASSIVSVKSTDLCPYKWVRINNQGYLCSPFEKLRTDDVNLPRQSFDQLYIPDGYVDVLRSSEILLKGYVYGDNARPWINPNISIDIDTVSDFDEAERFIIEDTEVFKYLVDQFPKYIKR